MASAYPGSIDTLATNKADATTTATDHAAHHNNMADAINKVEGELGTDPSGSFATVAARFASESNVRKTADEANTTTTLANVAEMAFPITIGADHFFEFFIPFSSAATTTGIALTVSIPTLAAGGYLSATIEIPRANETAIGTAPALANVQQVGLITASDDQVGSEGVPVINTVYLAHMKGVLSNPSAAGSIQLRFRSEVAASGVTIKKGAYGRMYLN